MNIHVGDQAPDFTLKSQHGEDVTLSSLRGRRVVLVFFPFAFSGVCTGEWTGLRDNVDLYDSDDTELLALSCDHFFSNRAFAEAEGSRRIILGDFGPHGRVCADYGVFNVEIGAAERRAFIVDGGGVVRWTVQKQRGEPRDVNEYRKVLSELT